MLRIFFGSLLPFLFISNLQAADCEVDLLTKGQLFVRMVRYVEKSDASAIATTIARALAGQPLANPFIPGTLAFSTFERYFIELTQTPPEQAREMRLRIIGSLDMEESMHLAQIKKLSDP